MRADADADAHICRCRACAASTKYKKKKQRTKQKINNIIVYSLWFGSDVPHAAVCLIEIEISASPASSCTDVLFQVLTYVLAHSIHPCLPPSLSLSFT